MSKVKQVGTPAGVEETHKNSFFHLFSGATFSIVFNLTSAVLVFTYAPRHLALMMSYASRSAYEFTESPQSTPVRLTKPATPVPVEETTPSKAAALSCTHLQFSISLLYPDFKCLTLSVSYLYLLAFFSSKWGSLTAKATEVAQRARGALHEYVASDSAINAANEIFALGMCLTCK